MEDYHAENARQDAGSAESRPLGLPVDDRQIGAVRHFTRFYTQHMGVLDRKLLRSPFSLSEARVLYEIAHHEETSARELGETLKLNAGYLSRLLSALVQAGLIEKCPSATDGRSRHLCLTPEGKLAFASLNARSHRQTATMLKSLPSLERDSLVEAMGRIEVLLGGGEAHRASYTLRAHRPGDIGWVIQSHAILYHREYGWDESFEALVADIAGKFLKDFDPIKEKCWIAEQGGRNVGSIFLVKDDNQTARIRLLLVDAKARGLGLGRRLVEEAIAFSRHAGYLKITLWTNDNLHAALRIYRAAGFQLTKEEPHRSFGRDLIGQTWTLDL